MSSNALKTPFAKSLAEWGTGVTADGIQQLGKALPCSVVEVVSSGIVTVSFEIAGSPYTLPNVTIPIFGSTYIRYPIHVGDLGVAFAADARLGGVSGLGGGVAGLVTPGNLTALMFAWCGSSKWTPTIDPEAVDIWGNVTVSPSEFGAFGHAKAAQQTVAGALSAVTDPAAKAVLLSLITALAEYGLIVDGTT